MSAWDDSIRLNVLAGIENEQTCINLTKLVHNQVTCVKCLRKGMSHFLVSIKLRGEYPLHCGEDKSTTPESGPTVQQYYPT